MTIAVVYRKGVFEPTEPADIPEGTAGKVEVSQPPETAVDDLRWGLGLFAMPGPDFKDIPEGFEDAL